MSKIPDGSKMKLAQVEEVEDASSRVFCCRVIFVGGSMSFYRKATEVYPVDPLIAALWLAQEKPC